MIPLARQFFLREIQQPDDQIDLARAALYIAQEEYPDLDPQEYLAALDSMAAEVEERLPPESYPLRIIQTLNHYLFQDLGFRGNQADYHDPRNSFLNEVIDRRIGIPISLSLIYLEVARRIQFPMVGIGLPGHFVLRPTFEDAGIYVDPFYQGEILFTEDCQERLVQVYGPTARLQPHFLQPISARAFLTRMLSNLKSLYLMQTDLEHALAAIERILLLNPQAVMELRDRGLIYYQFGRWQEARLDLETYLQAIPASSEETADLAVIRQLLQRMQPPDH